ncbi:hypothetical protein LINPERHAP1_LOCUS28845 [Linum perenne]
MVTTPMQAGLEDIRVADLMIPGLPKWDEEHCQDLFNGRDSSIIFGMPLPCWNKCDRIVWHYSKHGEYTIRSSYRVAMEKVVHRSHLNVAGIGIKFGVWRSPKRSRTSFGDSARASYQLNRCCREEEFTCWVTVGAVEENLRRTSICLLNVLLPKIAGVLQGWGVKLTRALE